MVVGVDEQRRAAAGAAGGDEVEAGNDFRRFEEHRRHQHARRAVVNRHHEPFSQRIGRPRRNPDDLEPFFGETIELSAYCVELAVGRDERGPNSQRQRRQQSRDELMRVLTERDVAVGIAEQSPKSGLHQRRLLGRALPLRIDEFRGVEPRLLLRLESNIRPGLV
jgi:hypothetical protein